MQFTLQSIARFCSGTLSILATTAAFGQTPAIIVEVCNEYSYTSQKQACLQELNGIHFVSEGAAQVCREYSYTSQKQSCLKAIGGPRHPDALATVCKEYSYTSQKQSCLEAGASITYIAPLSAQVCNEYSYTSQKQSCLVELGNLYFEEAAGRVCLEYSYTSQKQSCLKSIGGGSGQATLSQRLINRARSAMDAIDTGDLEGARQDLQRLEALIRENAEQINH